MAAQFPRTRLRRTRASDWSRRLVSEHRLSVDDLIWPIFVCEGKGERQDIPSMPGVQRISVDLAVEAAKQAADQGIPVMALFPYTQADRRSENGTEALNADNLMNQALKAIKDSGADIGTLADVALDPYTSHGQDGIVRDGQILNEATVDVLVKQALVQAESGADIVAPSDMMDGRIGAIRDALDAAGHTGVQIMAYSAKYASAFYGPFRDAVGASGVLKGDKKTYQMDPANAAEALREVELDITEGADSVMVKPGLAYLDILHQVKARFGVPTFAYQVSGEYAMLRAAAERGWLDYEAVMMEQLLAFKRAGADGILTYSALDVARILND